ncbi:MAG: hypothetical protein ABF479_21135, partial [Gluconacetobacter sp.]
MSAASRLWHRAPIWRALLYCIPLFTALTLLYPPAYLTRIAALRPVFDRINHTLGRTPPPPAQAAAPDA